MFDRYVWQLCNHPLNRAASQLKKYGVSADLVTVTGFVIGIGVVPALYFHLYPVALSCIAGNRICDGVDGALARITSMSDSGGFLDIVLDFIFYSAVVLGFALSAPDTNAPAAVFLLFSFIGTSSSFLAFAVMAQKRGLTCMRFPAKSLYYLSGICESTETIVVFVLACFRPSWFPVLAVCFAVLCLLTTIIRVVTGYMILAKTR
ncbi:CDP-alcohol phosphatidyltransferase family protein [Desulforhopalus singaporensis]|uniref:Phosphatidylglycerophosphate synthase n=1 Tax=Desulforhopalus singaporensis TaxID=91360 RepID=A0A1H0JWJ9_9BACT|nr:CDP-alcohol phosphatidyltransferase family protein [Desulforhopalus singaporensis]SDO47949.1 Phosphatidylglycerophosphate synthase [Desulforhopalus singaporensis]